MKVGVISLGCVKNRIDTEQMLWQLEQAGYELTGTESEADILIVNTCGFIQSAKEESIDTIFELAEYKKTGKCRLLVVTGCLSQRYAENLLEEIPEIDCLLGVNQYDQVVPLIKRALKGERGCACEQNLSFFEGDRVLTTPPYSAYIKIGDGCDNRCAYCAIPLIRGGYRSRKKENILNEMRRMAGQGVREQILIAQDTTKYGIDCGTSLKELLKEGAQIPGIDWLRVLYMYPDETGIDLLEEMARHENIVRYLDLPLQHISPELLKKMNRRGSPHSTRQLLKAAREMGFCLRTTFIVGFPGETEDDFKRLMDFTEEISFDRMGAFAFSAEEDTPAFEMLNQVPEEIKQERLDKLMQLQAGISLKRNQLRLGKTERVLICGHNGMTYTGRSAFEAPDADGEIMVISQNPLIEGQFYPVKISGAQTYDLTGEVIP